MAKQSAVHFDWDFDAHGFRYTASRCVRNFSGDAFADRHGLLLLDRFAYRVGNLFRPNFFHHFADGVGDLFLDGLPFITYAFDLFLLNLWYPDFLADLAWCTFNLDDSTGTRFEDVAAAF